MFKIVKALFLVICAFLLVSLSIPKGSAGDISDNDLPYVPRYPDAVMISYENYEMGEVPENWEEGDWDLDFYEMLNLEDIEIDGTNVIVTYRTEAYFGDIERFYGLLGYPEGVERMFDAGWMIKESWGVSLPDRDIGNVVFWRVEPVNSILFIWLWKLDVDNFTTIKIAHFTLSALPEGMSVEFSSSPIEPPPPPSKEFTENNPVRRIIFSLPEHQLYIAGRHDITAVPIPAKPPDVPSAPPGVVYHYIDISGDIIENARATIEFSVPKEWILANSVDKDSIKLFRFKDNQWVELPTSLVGEDNENVYFSAQTNGASIFAIGGESTPSAPPEETFWPAVVESWTSSISAIAEEPQAPEMPQAPYPHPLNFAIVLIVVVAIGALGAIYWLRFRK
jgi:PGF-pre-PGF domain-containing protein